MTQPGEPGYPQPEPPPEPEPQPQPEPEAPMSSPPEPQPPDQSARAAELEAELAQIRQGAVAGAKTMVRLDPAGPHSAFTYAGVTVTTDPVPVSARMVAQLLEAAADAGVKLLTEA